LAGEFLGKILQRDAFPFNGICAENEGWKPLIDCAARNNPRAKVVKTDEILDDRVMKELDESGFVKYLGMKRSRDKRYDFVT